MNNNPIQSDYFEKVEYGLFLVVGCGRSGTTLLKSILNAHSKICLPAETNFFRGISRGSFGVDGESLEQKLDKLFSKWWISDIPMERETVKQNLGNHEPSWRNLFVAMLASIPSPGKEPVCFGEKTVDHIAYADELLQQYPRCKLLQIIRDPRAALASYQAAAIGSNQPSQLIADWSVAAEVDAQLGENPRYLSVKFEDLIESTEVTLKSICNFLEVDFEPDMLNYHARKTPGFSPEQTHHQNTQKPIFKSGLEKWKNKLSNTDIALLEIYLGQHMERLGYEKTGASVNFPKARFFVSVLCERLSKSLVRRPKQLLKAIRAKIRQSKS